MAMELFEKGTYMYSLMADYWVLNRKLLSIDAENLMQDDFWEFYKRAGSILPEIQNKLCQKSGTRIIKGIRRKI